MTSHIPNPQDAFVEAHRRMVRGNLQKGGSTPLPFRAVDPERRARSLQTCHRFAAVEQPVRKARMDGNAYVPELSARIDNDPNLTDGARRCARKIAEESYRRDRETRTLPVTVSYLAKALGRCRRTVQRYLRLLEAQGYIAVQVVAGRRSRLCIGLIVRLQEPLFAAHHKARWPETRGNPGATAPSQKHRFFTLILTAGDIMPVAQWTMRCMDGVYRSLMKTLPTANLLSAENL